MSELVALRTAYGEALVELKKEMDNLVVLDADLAAATQTCIYQKEYPEHFCNMGIAEQNMMGVAAGLALEGFTPFASTFALFGAGRAYEQIRNSIAYQNLNVKIALTHSGVTVGEDGGSHQSIEDIALMRQIPNMTVIVPSDPIEMKKAVFAAAKHDGPVYLRVARPPVPNVTKIDDKFEIGKANVLKDGSDICIFATGLMLAEAVAAAETLEEEGINAAVVNIHTIKPIDTELIISMADKCKKLITVEEHSIIGGLGSAVLETLDQVTDVKLKRIGVEDVFGQSGTPQELLEEHGLTSDNIIVQVKKMLK